MSKNGLSILLLLFAFQVGIYAQSTCSCGVGNGGCTASQSCPSGHIAVCTCSASGCSSLCNKRDGELPEEFTSNTVEQLESAKTVADFDRILSKVTGKQTKFSPESKSVKFDLRSVVTVGDIWATLGGLSKFGKVTILGREMDFWLGTRNDLLNGREVSFCTGGATVNNVLAELSFYTGKRYRVIAGNAEATVTTPIKGNGVNDLLNNLATAYKLTIITE